MNKIKQMKELISNRLGLEKVKDITVKCAELDKVMNLIKKNPQTFTTEQKEEVYKGYERLLDQLEQDGFNRIPLIKLDELRKEINDNRAKYR
jgi:hypothetical protein